MMATRTTAIVLTAGLASMPALAIFGLGDIVFDPTSYGELVSQLTQLQQEYSQLIRTYNMVTSQYNQMVANARMITGKARWRAITTPWMLPTASNTYGTTGAWISALNTGIGTLNAYNQAATPMLNYSPVWGSIGASQRDQIGRNYGTVELSDGIAVNALSQLGSVRGNSFAVENALDSLEADSLSDNDSLNSEVGVLNKINAGAIIGARNSQDTNKLLASLLDHQIVESKARRDAAAQSINNDIALRQMAPDIDSQHLAGTTAVLTTYRLP
jgi:type IV secretion system protein TrbJ